VLQRVLHLCALGGALGERVLHDGVFRAGTAQRFAQFKVLRHGQLGVGCNNQAGKFLQILRKLLNLLSLFCSGNRHIESLSKSCVGTTALGCPASKGWLKLWPRLLPRSYQSGSPGPSWSLGSSP